MADPIRVGIIGAGIGAQHVAAFRQLPDLFEVAAICDLDRARAEGLAAQTSGAKVETDLERVLSDGSIDLVDICLPPHLHLPVMLSTLAAEKAVICEKPLVTSLGEMDALENAAERSGRRVFPVFQYRFGPGTAKLRALIDAGLAGKPFVASLDTHWNRGTDYYAIPWRGTWAGERGGAVLTHAIHAHDLLTSVFGPVASVSAHLATRVNEIETEDCAALAIVHANGALATSSITLGAADDTSRLRLVFEGLTAESGRLPYTPATDDWTFTARAPQSQADIDAVLADLPEVPLGYLGLFTEIAKALKGAPNTAVSLADARASLDFITALYTSSRNGRAELLPIAKDHPLYEGWLP